MRITFEKADEFNDILTNKEVRLLIKTYKLSLNEVEQLIIEIKNEYAETWFLMSQYKRLKAISKQINIIIKDLNNKTNTIITKGEVDSYIASYKITDKTLNTALNIGLSFNLLDTKSIEKAIQNPFTKVTSIERNTNNIKQLKVELTQNLILGNSYRTTAKKISERYGVALNKSERIVRTENHRVQLEARLNGLEDAEDMGIKLMKEWVSAIDERTRFSHVALNGTVITVNENFRSMSGGYGKAPGQMGNAGDDINCRCSLASVIL